MPNINDMLESKFLKQADAGRGVLVTVMGCEQHDVSMQDKPTEMKWCLLFQELAKPLVLNKTNMLAMQRITGSDNTDDWLGVTIVLYADPTVMYGGEIKGGLRIRERRDATASPAPTPPIPPVPAQPPTTQAPLPPGEDVPF